jgi:hypothetical protein
MKSAIQKSDRQLCIISISSDNRDLVSLPVSDLISCCRGSDRVALASIAYGSVGSFYRTRFKENTQLQSMRLF